MATNVMATSVTLSLNVLPLLRAVSIYPHSEQRLSFALYWGILVVKVVSNP